MFITRFHALHGNAECEAQPRIRRRSLPFLVPTQRVGTSHYKKAKPNRFAARGGKQLLKVVVLDEDVAQVFTTPESVNQVLRALINSMPQSTNGGDKT